MTAAVDVVMDAGHARVLTDRIKVGVDAIWELVTQAYLERADKALGYSSWDDYCTREFGTSRLRLPREERGEVVASLRESGLSVRAIAAATGDSVGTVHAALSGVQNRTPEAESPAPDPECDGACVADECVCPEVPGEIPEQQLPPLPENYMNITGALTTQTPGVTDRVAGAVAEEVRHEEPQSQPNPITGMDGKSYRQSPPAPKEPRRKPISDTARGLGLDLAKITKRFEELGADDRFVRNKNEVAPRLRHHLEQAIKVLTDLNDQLTSGV